MLNVSKNAFVARFVNGSAPHLVGPLFSIRFSSLVELLRNRGDLVFRALGGVLLAWGYIQYRVCGAYRRRHGGGGPGMDRKPQCLVIEALTAHAKSDVSRSRYILARVAITFRHGSRCALRRSHVFWFHYRIRKTSNSLKAFSVHPISILERVNGGFPHML